MPVNILNLPGLTVLDFKETDDEYHIKASPIEIVRICPNCESSTDIVNHGWRTLVIRDIPSHGKAVAVHLDVPRLKCRSCNKTFTTPVPEVDTGREMTMRLAKWVGRQALEYTYAEIAKQVKVDEKTVRNVFDEYVAELEKQYQRETPIWLGIDEIKLKRFRAIFTNLHGRSLIAIHHRSHPFWSPCQTKNGSPIAPLICGLGIAEPSWRPFLMPRSSSINSMS